MARDSPVAGKATDTKQNNVKNPSEKPRRLFYLGGFTMKIIPIRTGIPIPAQVTPMLNEEQQAAIQEVKGYHAINSGAGTGKSTVLAARLRRIQQLYPAATVLMLANKAALELQQRVGNMTGVNISTLHSLSYHKK